MIGEWGMKNHELYKVLLDFGEMATNISKLIGKLKEKQMKFIIRRNTRGWYIRALKDDRYAAWFVWKDLEFHIDRGYVSSKHKISYSAPGYYPTEISAIMFLNKFKEKYNMADKIEITVKVNGVATPLHKISEQSLLTVRENSKPREVPVARVADYCGRRLILRLPKDTDKYIGQIVVLDINDGHIVNHWYPSEEQEYVELYNNVKTIS